MVTVFGGTGYIGRRFCELYSAQAQPRDALIPSGNKILYLISTTHNHHLATNPYIDIDTNLTHLMRVLESSRRVPDVEFNFVSSWFVYGAVGRPADERTPCDPQGFYSITKRAAEQLLMAYCQHHKIPWRIMRLCNVIGDRDHNSGPNKNVLQRMIEDCRSHRDIQLINNGDFLRDYLHRDDVCDAIDMVISQGDRDRIYNIGSGNSIRFRQALEYIQTQTVSRSRIINQQRFDVVDCLLDCSRLTKLGWRPTRTWQQAIDSMLID